MAIIVVPTSLDKVQDAIGRFLTLTALLATIIAFLISGGSDYLDKTSRVLLVYDLKILLTMLPVLTLIYGVHYSVLNDDQKEHRLTETISHWVAVTILCVHVLLVGVSAHLAYLVWTS